MILLKKELVQGVLVHLAQEPHIYTEVHGLITGLQKGVPLEQYLSQYEAEKAKNIQNKPKSETIALVPQE